MGVATRRLSAGEAGLGANFWGSSSSPTIFKKKKSRSTGRQSGFSFS
jgi:hypothetical protein